MLSFVQKYFHSVVSREVQDLSLSFSRSSLSAQKYSIDIVCFLNSLAHGSLAHDVWVSHKKDEVRLLTK